MNVLIEDISVGIITHDLVQKFVGDEPHPRTYKRKRKEPTLSISVKLKVHEKLQVTTVYTDGNVAYMCTCYDELNNVSTLYNLTVIVDKFEIPKELVAITRPIATCKL